MSYEQGFIEKCAEFGVDPEELVKIARTVFIGDERFELPDHVRASNARQFVEQNKAKYDPTGRMPAKPKPRPKPRPQRTAKPAPVKRPKHKFNPADSLPTPVKERPRPKFNPAHSTYDPSGGFKTKKDTLYSRMYPKETADLGQPTPTKPVAKPAPKPQPKPVAKPTPQPQPKPAAKPKPRPARKQTTSRAPMIYGDAEIKAPTVSGAVSKYQQYLRNSPGYARANSPVRQSQPIPVRSSGNPYDAWFGN